MQLLNMIQMKLTNSRSWRVFSQIRIEDDEIQEMMRCVANDIPKT